MTTRKNAETKIPKAASFWKGNKMLPLNEDGHLILGRKKAPPVDAKLAKAVLDILDAGLTNGIGEPVEPGGMCVEAAVSAAMGMDTTDGPICVSPELRSMKISINDDGKFNDDKDRAMGLRRIAIAQLGTQKLTLAWEKEDGRKYPVSVPSKAQTFKWSRFRELLNARIEKMVAEVNAKIVPKQPKLSKAKKEMLAAVEKATKKDSEYQKEDLIVAVNDYLGIEKVNEDDLFFTTDDADSYTNFINEYEDKAVEHGVHPDQETARDYAIEQAVQVLVRMKTPGSKYLYLTEGKAAKAAAKAKARKH